MALIILDDLEEEVTEEKRKAVLSWFDEYVSELCSFKPLPDDYIPERPIPEILKGGKNGNDK